MYSFKQKIKYRYLSMILIYKHKFYLPYNEVKTNFKVFNDLTKKI